MWKCSSLLAVALAILTLPAMARSDSLIDAASYRSLVGDKRAFRLGDPLIVLVVESTTAESSAGTGGRSDVDFGGKVDWHSHAYEAGLGVSGQGDAAGQTTRKGRATTQLSARIVEVMPGNMFRIEGQRSLVVNGEKQKVVVSGVVRGEDIAEDNTLPSNRIAEANIEITGDGVVDDAQRQSIVFRVLKWLRIL